MMLSSIGYYSVHQVGTASKYSIQYETLFQISSKENQLGNIMWF